MSRFSLTSKGTYPSARGCRRLHAQAPPLRSTFKAGAVAVVHAAAAGGNLPRTWSNPGGLVLTEVVAGKLWAAERPFVWNGIDVGGKMAVVRCANGGLWVHSPVALDAELEAELAAIGEVEHIVSPNFEHVKYAPQWIEAYPNAIAYACPGLQEVAPEIPYTASILSSGSSTPPDTWPSEIEACWLDYETNPFTSKPFFNEVVFFHRPTLTLLVTDAFWNYPQENVPAGTVFWKKGMDKVYLPFYRKLMVKGREAAFEAAMNKISSWPFERLLPCHGTVIECGARDAFEAHMLEGIPQAGHVEQTALT